MIESQVMVGLMLLVFAKRGCPEISLVEASNVKTGLGGHYGNKGGIGVRLLVEDTSFCFVACHLAAGQGEVVARNADLVNIMNGMRFERLCGCKDSLACGGDGTFVYDHQNLLLFGDLNYRIDGEISELLERKDFEICWDSFGRLLKLGIPMGLQFSITAIGTIIVQSAVNIYGPVHMAGFSAAGKIQNIFATVFTAFGATIATYVGQNRGAGKMDRVKQGVRYTQMMVLGWSVFVMFLMFFFGKYLTYLFVDPSEQDVVNVSVTYFRTVFWAYPFLGSIFLYRNTLQGMGYGLVPMLGGVFELVARTGIVVLIAGHTSFAGVCMADPTAWIAALIPLIPYYFHVMKKYKNKSQVQAVED